MTKTQEKNEKSIASLEGSFNTIIKALRTANNEGKFKKQHTVAMDEAKYLVNRVQKHVTPKSTGPLKW